MPLLSLLLACATSAPDPAVVPAAAAPDDCGLCEMLVEASGDQAACLALQDPVAQARCVQVAESVAWWLTNERAPLDWGCQTDADWEQPCPARAVCGWVQHELGPFCPSVAAAPTPSECADACTHQRMAEAIDGSLIEQQCRQSCGIEAASLGLPGGL